MTSTLPLSRQARPFCWPTPLLLPALPLLVVLMRGQAALDAGALITLGGLTGVALALAFGLHPLMRHAGWSVRKEFEQIRPVWLLSILLVQCPLLFSALVALGPTLFFATCMMIAAVPFGAEFQHRTIPGLLAQPVDRAILWRTKMGVIGAALAVHALCFGLAVLSDPELGTVTGSPESILIGTLLGVAVAWGSGPFWSLIGRGVLSGLVFSLAVLITLGVSGLLLFDALRNSLSAAGRDAESILANLNRAVEWGILPGYAALCAWFGFRRWTRLEATDGTGAGDSIFARTRLGRDAAASGLRRSIASHLWLKELRLHPVTLLMLGMCAVLAVVPPLPSDAPILQETPTHCLFLLACATLLLAGATPFAEERRLGTHEAQLLLPASRALQWGIKVACSALLSAVALAAAGLALARIGVYFNQTAVIASVVLGAALALSLALFASAHTSNVLRALLLTLAMGAVLAVGFGAASAFVVWWPERAWRPAIDKPAASFDWAWRAAESMSQAEASELLGAGSPDKRLASAIRGTSLYATLAVLLFVCWTLRAAWVNASLPASQGRTLFRPVFRLLAMAGLLIVVGAAGLGLKLRHDVRQWHIANAAFLLKRSQAWPAGDRLLLSRHPGDWVGGVRVLFPPKAARNTNVIKGREIQFNYTARASDGAVMGYFSMPLQPRQRRLIIEEALIDNDVREALRSSEAKVPPPAP